MSTPATITQTRALAELASQSERTKNLWILVQRTDGTTLEGDLAGVEQTHVTVVDGATEVAVTVAAGEIAALSLRVPHQSRELLLAIAAIIGATVALVGYASFPWVRPAQGDVTKGFLLLASATGALLPIALSRTRLGKWLTKWRKIYPPGD